MKSTLSYIIPLMILLFGNVIRSNAQIDSKNYEIEARAHYGYMYFQNDESHSALGRYCGHTPSFEFSIHRNTYGRHRWEVLHNYPSIGLTFYYSQLKGSQYCNELGDVFALYPFINFPINNSESSKITFKLGVGLSYLTKKYDPVENYHNYAIGSHVNAAINLSFEYRQRLADRLFWVNSFGLTHFSNGATRSPNMGINIFSLATGFSWYLQKPKDLLDKRLRPKHFLFEFDGRRYLVSDFQYTIGFKDMSQQYSNHDLFIVHDFAGNVMFQISERDRLGAGLEFVIDNSGEITHPGWTKEIGFLLSYEMLLDRVSFMFNIGLRNNQPLPANAFLFYQKLGLRGYITDNSFVCLSFTTYDIKADFISIGFGHHFNHKYYLPKNEKKSRTPGYLRRH